MNVYIDAEYFDLMENVFEKEKHNFSSTIINNIKVMINMLSVLKVNTTLTNTDIVKYAKGMAGHKNYSSMKDVIISRAINNHTLKPINEITEIKDYNGFYFTVENLENSFNVVAKDKEFSFEYFFDNCNQNGFQFNGRINKLADFVPPTNAMIIVDPFIFANPFKEKLGLLIEFVNLYKGDLKRLPFQMTILTKGDNPTLIQSAFEELNKIENLEIEIVKFDNLERDRFFLANYVFSNTGHPFQLENTIFNQNFLAVEQDVSKIRINYSQFRDKLKQIKQKISSQPSQIGSVKYKWSNSEFENRLFELIK